MAQPENPNNHPAGKEEQDLSQNDPAGPTTMSSHLLGQLQQQFDQRFQRGGEHRQQALALAEAAASVDEQPEPAPAQQLTPAERGSEYLNTLNPALRNLPSHPKGSW